MSEFNQDLTYEERPLLLATAQGDEAAFKALVDRYWNRVYHNTLALVKRPAVAQDLTQDVFLKIWLQRDKLATVERFSTYIYVVGRNQVLNALRTKILESAVDEGAGLREDLHTPDVWLEGKDLQRLLMEGVNQLTAQQKLIFTLSRLEGLSHQEIADRLGISKNTVKVHMVIALNFLRGWMYKLGYLALFFFLKF